MRFFCCWNTVGGCYGLADKVIDQMIVLDNSNLPQSVADRAAVRSNISIALQGIGLTNDIYSKIIGTERKKLIDGIAQALLQIAKTQTSHPEIEYQDFAAPPREPVSLSGLCANGYVGCDGDGHAWSGDTSTCFPDSFKTPGDTLTQLVSANQTLKDIVASAKTTVQTETSQLAEKDTADTHYQQFVTRR